MQKTIRLTESELRNLVAEAISEIDYSTVYNAKHKGNDTFLPKPRNTYSDYDDLSFYDVEESLNVVRDALQRYSGGEPRVEGTSGQARALLPLLDKIEAFFERKKSQGENLERFGNEYGDRAREEFFAAMAKKYPGKFKRLGRESWNDKDFYASDDDESFSTYIDNDLEDVMNSLSPQARSYFEREGLPTDYEPQYRRR